MPRKSNWKHLSKPRPQTRKNPLPIVGGGCAPRQNPSNVSGDEGLRRSWVRTATSLTRKLDAPRSRGPYGKGAGFTERQPEVDQEESPAAFTWGCAGTVHSSSNTVTRPPGAQTFGISGMVAPTTGGGGATVTLSGAASATTTANGSGTYSFTGLAAGTYAVTPSNTGSRSLPPRSQQRLQPQTSLD
jgi:hypothetical protein